MRRGLERFHTVFGKEPPSVMPTTKHLVKLPAFVKELILRGICLARQTEFVKELIPRDICLVRLAEFIKERVQGDDRSLKLRRTKLLAAYVRIQSRQSCHAQFRGHV